MNEFVHGNLTDASALLDRHACTLSYFLSPALLQYEFCKEGISQSGNTSTIEKLVRMQRYGLSNMYDTFDNAPFEFPRLLKS